jgi:hypothetical protein
MLSSTLFQHPSAPLIQSASRPAGCVSRALVREALIQRCRGPEALFCLIIFWGTCQRDCPSRYYDTLLVNMECI